MLKAPTKNAPKQTFQGDAIPRYHLNSTQKRDTRDSVTGVPGPLTLVQQGCSGATFTADAAQARTNRLLSDRSREATPPLLRINKSIICIFERVVNAGVLVQSP